MILFRVEKCLCFFTTAGVTHTPAVYSHKYTNSMMYVCPKNIIFEGNSQEDAVNMVRERARQVDAIRNILQIVRVDVIIHWSEIRQRDPYRPYQPIVEYNSEVDCDGCLGKKRRPLYSTMLAHLKLTSDMY